MLVGHLLGTLLWMANASFAHLERPPVSPCVSLLQAFHARVESPKTESFLGPSALLRTPSVEILDEVPGRHGGQLLRLRKLGTQWLSSYATKRFDPQGDPRWFIEVFGTEAARFFGFEILSGGEMFIPDRAEFQGALDVLSQRLNWPIAVHYYGPKNGLRVGSGFYSRKFSQDFGLPYAVRGNFLLHDAGFHTGAILLSDEILKLRQGTWAYVLRFADFARQRSPENQWRLKALEVYLEAWSQLEASHIDTGTAHVNVGMVEFLRNPQTRQHLDAPFINLSYGSGDPALYLKGLAKGLFHGHSAEFSLIDYLDPAQLAESKENYPESALNADIETYIAQFPPPDLWSRVRELGTFQAWVEDQCLKMVQRREQIEALAVQWLRENGF